MENKMQQFALNKSSFSLKNIAQNTQTLPLFRKMLKTESIYKKIFKMDSWIDETKWSN
jgi:hypothetical protein